MTISELNERAARLCGRKPVEHFEEWDIETRSIWTGTVEFSPATDPADCAVVKRVMREKGLSLYVEDEKDQYFAAFLKRYEYGPSDTAGQAYAPTEEHAVTLAAVRAIEGESK